MARYIDADKLTNKLKRNDRLFITFYDIEEAPTEDVAPVVHANPVIEIHHYFEDDDFGDLNFYGIIKCSNCGQKIGSVSGDTIENPCETFKENWDINPKIMYAEQLKKMANRLALMDLKKYCPSCGAKLDKER